MPEGLAISVVGICERLVGLFVKSMALNLTFSAFGFDRFYFYKGSATTTELHDHRSLR